MLPNIGERDSQFMQLGRGQQRGPIVSCFVIDPPIFADLNPNTLVIAIVSSRVPTHFIHRQTLIDRTIIDGEMPGNLALLSVGSFLVVGMRGRISSGRIIIRVMDGDLCRSERCSRSIAMAYRNQINDYT